MNGFLATYWRALAGGTRNTPLDRLLLLLLLPPAVAYALLLLLRSLLYRSGIFATRRLPRPVVSVGNITVGGTGKTPVAAYIARQLIAQGFKVALLSRGYGGSLEGSAAVVSDGRRIALSAEECGDEPLLLARTVPGLAVVIGSDRYQAGLLAMRECPPDVFILDDGFQHMQLHRDLNILLLDCARPFGNGRCLPAGLLREPRGAARRADLVIYTRCPENVSVPTVVPGLPSCVSRHGLADGIPLTGGEPVPLTSLHGRKLLAFAGIAEPQPFFDGLKAQGLDLVHCMNFPDHARYDDGQTAGIAAALRACSAELALTTEKDGVKLTRLSQDLAGKVLPVRLELRIDDPAPLEALLRNLLQK